MYGRANAGLFYKRILLSDLECAQFTDSAPEPVFACR